MVRDKPSADTNPQRWSDEDEAVLLELVTDESVSDDEIYSKFSERPTASLDNKIRRLKKENGLYNSPYAAEKYDYNESWIAYADRMTYGPVNIFEGYAGTGESSKIYEQYSGTHIACEMEDDVFKQLESSVPSVTAVHDDCANELHRRNAASERFDFIDLDPFGSPFDTIPLALSLITNGYLTVTYGDINLQRWGRTNVLMKQYRMPETTDWMEVVEHMVGWTVFEGLRQRTSRDVRTVTPLSVQPLGGQSGVVRILYEVEKTGVLSDALSSFEERTRSTDRPLPHRRYDLSNLL